MSFQIHALPAAQFESLFALSEDKLASVPAVRMSVDTKPGFPCRVSLADAEIGETVMLVNFEHQSGNSPYRSAHAIFVRERAEQAFPGIGEVPEVLRTRLIYMRAFDDSHYMLDANVVNGSCLSDSIPLMLQDPEVAYLHLHNAARGCYAARATRA